MGGETLANFVAEKSESTMPEPSLSIRDVHTKSSNRNINEALVDVVAPTNHITEPLDGQIKLEEEELSGENFNSWSLVSVDDGSQQDVQVASFDDSSSSARFLNTICQISVINPNMYSCHQLPLIISTSGIYKCDKL